MSLHNKSFFTLHFQIPTSKQVFSFPGFQYYLFGQVCLSFAYKVKHDAVIRTSALWYTIRGRFNSHPTNTILIWKVARNQNIGSDIRRSHRGYPHTPSPSFKALPGPVIAFPRDEVWQSTNTKALAFSWAAVLFLEHLDQHDAKSAFLLSEQTPRIQGCVCACVSGFVCVWVAWDDVIGICRRVWTNAHFPSLLSPSAASFFYQWL